MSDFIIPSSKNIKDYIGCFCVTAGFGSDELCQSFEKENDDYSSIMVKALADRFAEAFAEYLHKEVRIKHWGYSSNENFSNYDLIKEKYVGIRPAPGYPACPDHLEKNTIWKLLKVEEKIGVKLTESLAMWPAASVSGYYFANPNSKYFGLGKIDKDQVKDYSKRRKIGFKGASKWLNPNIRYSSNYSWTLQNNPNASNVGSTGQLNTSVGFSLTELVEKLSQLGLSFGMDIKDLMETE